MSVSSTVFIPGSYDVKQLDALMIGEEMSPSASLAPPPAQRMDRVTDSHDRYHTHLCGCCCSVMDMAFFLDAVMARWCVLDDIRWMIKGGKARDDCTANSRAECVESYCYSSVYCLIDLALCQISSCRQSVLLRHQLNKRIGVTGETRTCCVAVFLLPCSLAQMARELKIRGKGEDFNVCCPGLCVLKYCCSDTYKELVGRSRREHGDPPNFVSIFDPWQTAVDGRRARSAGDGGKYDKDCWCLEACAE